MTLDAFGGRIEYRFADVQLLRRALTHRSHDAAHNERLEFLGDSVLNCAIALALYRKFPQLSEGELSRLRAGLVSGQSLATVGEALEIGTYILLGEGELRSGGSSRPSILADAVEAVIGAVFIDGGFDAALCLVQKLFADAIEAIDPAKSGKDPKTLLQELLQGRRLPLPQYTVLEILGEAHRQVFRVECRSPELNLKTRGEGASRRIAEQEAARQAYEMALRA